MFAVLSVQSCDLPATVRSTEQNMNTVKQNSFSLDLLRLFDSFSVLRTN